MPINDLEDKGRVFTVINDEKFQVWSCVENMLFYDHNKQAIVVEHNYAVFSTSLRKQVYWPHFPQDFCCVTSL